MIEGTTNFTHPPWYGKKERAQKKFKIKKLDVFNKGGNCKLQEGVLIYIEKTSMGTFNKGGNCKLQFPEVTFCSYLSSLFF